MSAVLIRKILPVAIGTLAALMLLTSIWHCILNKFCIPNKEDRLNNLRVGYGITELTQLDESDISSELQAALSKYTNWDNLFLSDNFKTKYKSRKDILEDVKHISAVRGGITYKYGSNAIVIYAEKKPGFFDTDKSDDITTEYYFRYILNDEGEIDDLILLEKRDVYTINGEPVNDDKQ